MNSGYDLNNICNDGYLIIPISIAHMSNKQSPEECYKIVSYFSKKINTNSNDVIFLYTNGLYFNSLEASYTLRLRTNKQIINHANGLRKLIQKRKEFMPRAFHYLPIDYVILNCSHFDEFFNILKKLEKLDAGFREEIKKDIGVRDYTDANVNFILEEVVVSHILKQRLIDLPRTLVRNDIWRLIVYPGSYIKSEAYVWQNCILPKKDTINPYNNGQYDFEKKKYFIFN